MNPDREGTTAEDPNAQLERALIDDFLRSAGYDIHTVQQLPEDRRSTLLRQASEYAPAALAEIEARAHYVHDIHGSREK